MMHTDHQGADTNTGAAPWWPVRSHSESSLSEGGSTATRLAGMSGTPTVGPPMQESVHQASSDVINKHKINSLSPLGTYCFKKWYLRGKELNIYSFFLISTVPLGNQIVDKRNFSLQRCISTTE
uniref:Uncharacterized protein n=1 Tax=Myotis myotis TaxID=51298 RepID=A0A7J7VYF1_MYOMY|nr:hypothetical protein mMyoMyo1_012253 [Myotis myotis]